MTVTWPGILKARSCDVHLRNFMRSGGRSLLGTEQRVYSDAGRVEVGYSGIVVNTREKAAAYRAMVARLRAGEDIMLAIHDVYRPLGSHSPGALVTLSADAALRATQLWILSTGVAIAPGHHVTIGDRVHIVTEVVSGPASPPLLNQIVCDATWTDSEPWTDAVDGSAGYSVKIMPPLRAAHAAGTVVECEALALRAVLKDQDDGDLILDLGRFGSPNLTFVESF